MKTGLFILLGALGAAYASAADGDPTIGPVTMTPSDDASMVTIGYSLSGAPAVITLDIETNTLADASGDWVSIGGKAVSFAIGDVWREIQPGDGTILWPAKMAWPGHDVPQGCIRAAVSAWALDDTPDYMVFSLVKGETVRTHWYPGADFLPGGLLGNEMYRTSSLVLRRIRAKGVTWKMGSDETIEKVYRDTDGRETQHDVTLDHDYYIAVFPVTQAQWYMVNEGGVSGLTRSFYSKRRLLRPVERIAFIRIRECGMDAWKADSSYDYPNAPCTDSFLGRLRTISKLNGGTELAFDLPGEAEWEYACRAGHGDGFWGDGSKLLSTDRDENLMRLTRCAANQSNQDADSEPEVGGTSEVGYYEPNSWGLYDMHGNVGEYCLDFWKRDISTRSQGEIVTRAEADLKTEHQRRGCDPAKARYHRSAQRNSRSETEESKGLGFRVVCRGRLD